MIMTITMDVRRGEWAFPPRKRD